MKTIKTVENQTIYDLAVQTYGTAEAVGEILDLNPDIINDPKDYNVDLSEFFFDLPIKSGLSLQIDENSPLINKNVLRELSDTITTFEKWQEQ